MTRRTVEQWYAHFAQSIYSGCTRY